MYSRIFTKSVTLAFRHVSTGGSLEESNTNEVSLVRLYFLSTIREILKAMKISIPISSEIFRQAVATKLYPQYYRYT